VSKTDQTRPATPAPGAPKKQVHRVQGYLRLRSLRAALEAFAPPAGYASQKEEAA